jgi:hypothetical protein
MLVSLWTHVMLVLFTTRYLAYDVQVSPVYKTEISGRGDPLRWPRDTLYPLKLALPSKTSGGRSLGIVRLRTKTTPVSIRIVIWILNKQYERVWTGLNC